MFRILVATGRSARRRSPSTVSCFRPFHTTLSTRRSSSAATKPVKRSAEIPESSLRAANLDSPQSLSNSLRKSTPQSSDSAAAKTKPSRSSIPRTRKSYKLADSTAESATLKLIKRRTSRTRSNVEIPIVTQEPAVSEPFPHVVKSPNNSRIEQSKSPSPAEPITAVENRHRENPFTSQNVRDDLLAYLKWAGGGFGLGKAIGDNRRMNILSRPLCDDIMHRLGPPLQKHIGCDIIDVNPGVGVWSEKIHKFLKPRSHILLEPDQERYQVLLQPLLDEPGSTYKFIPKSGVIWGHLEKVLSKEYLPHQEAFERGDPRLEKPNDSLLFIANLGSYPRRAYRGFPSVANLVLYQLLSAVRAHSLFQRYGRVRMLIWLENDERNTVLPRTVSFRRKSAIEAEISCGKIEEVASSTEEVGAFQRENHLEVESTRLVHEKMKEIGVRVPEHRESTFLKQLRSNRACDVGEEIFTTAFLEEIRDLEARFAAHEFTEEIVDSVKRPQGQKGRPMKNTTRQYARLRDLRYRQSAELVKYQARQDIKVGLDNIYSLQRQVQIAKPSERPGLEEELKQRIHAWKQDFGNLSNAEQEVVSIAMDNIRAFETKPPTLMWDRRECEPLKVYPNEFYPQKEMCLLDFQPKSLWPVLQMDFPENYDILEYIIGQLLIVPTQTIKKGLSALAPGAYDYLIAECPSLTDPTKGGSLDPSLMTVRRLTEEMFKEIIETWTRWPFKPTRSEVLSRMGSSIFDPDALESEERGQGSFKPIFNSVSYNM